MTRGLSSIRSRSRCLVAPLHPPPLLPATLMHAGSGKPYDMFYLFVLHTVHPLSLSLSLPLCFYLYFDVILVFLSLLPFVLLL